MSRSPVQCMVDAAVRCVKCGKPPGCSCWDKVVHAECSRCGATRDFEDDPAFMGERNIVLDGCPDCLAK